MGPTLFIYAPSSVEEPELAAIHELLCRHGHDITRESQRTWSFWLAPGTCMAGLSVVPFGAESDGRGGCTEVYMEPPDQAAFSSALGFSPQAALQLDNYCGNDPEGHQALGKLAASLSRQLSGAVDLGGVDPSTHCGRGTVSRVVHSDGATVYLANATAMEAWASSESFWLEC